MGNTAYIFDAIRTPRGKGKADGSLHEVKPVTLLSDLLTTSNSAMTWTLPVLMTLSWVV